MKMYLAFLWFLALLWLTLLLSFLRFVALFLVLVFAFTGFTLAFVAFSFTFAWFTGFVFTMRSEYSKIENHESDKLFDLLTFTVFFQFLHNLGIKDGFEKINHQVLHTGKLAKIHISNGQLDS